MLSTITIIHKGKDLLTTKNKKDIISGGKKYPFKLNIFYIMKN